MLTMLWRINREVWLKPVTNRQLSKPIVLALVWVALTTMGCGQQSVEEQEVESMAKKSIEMVLSEHTGRLMDLPGVVGTAQGECSGRPCIHVYVLEKTPDLLNEIPTQIEGYAVAVYATGEIRPIDGN